MHVLTFLAQIPPPTASPEFHPAEVLFFKLAALVLVLLWVTYLVKEIFFSHRGDPRMTDLIGGMGQTNVQLAVMNANIAHLSDGAREQREREKEMWIVINGIRRSLTTMAEEHAHLEGQTVAAGIKPETRRPSTPR